MYCVAKTFSNLFPDVLPQANDEARRPHLDDLAIVRHAVEGGMYRQSPFAEERLDVEGHLHVSGIHSLVLDDDGVEFILFSSGHK